MHEMSFGFIDTEETGYPTWTANNIGKSLIRDTLPSTPGLADADVSPGDPYVYSTGPASARLLIENLGVLALPPAATSADNAISARLVRIAVYNQLSGQRLFGAVGRSMMISCEYLVMWSACALAVERTTSQCFYTALSWSSVSRHMHAQLQHTPLSHVLQLLHIFTLRPTHQLQLVQVWLDALGQRPDGRGCSVSSGTCVPSISTPSQLSCGGSLSASLTALASVGEWFVL